MYSSHRYTLALLGLLTLSATPLVAQKAPPANNKPPILFLQDTPYVLEDAFPGLKFEQPLGLSTVPEDKSRLFVIEKTGRIHVVTGLDNGKLEKKLFLDLTRLPKATLETTGECGVLGLAFPADHAKTGRCYVYYSLKIGGQLYQRVSRFKVLKNNPNRADNTSEQPLLTQQDEASNHNGGDLQFGPDGYLYVSVGDGGAANDKFDQARFINKGFHAGILRIDVNKKTGSLAPNPHPSISLDQAGEAHYSIPADNPLVGTTSYHGQPVDPKSVRTEFWATGLRNPWRISFDPETDRLFTGDVGQNLYEEVNIITRGGDYGWSYREALHPFHQGPGGDKEPAEFKPIEPIYEYPRTVGLSITGGVVYHGNKFPDLKKHYIFADYATGRVIALQDTGKPIWADKTLSQEAGIAGIGIDPRDGEVLFANMAFGQIKRLKAK